MTQLLTLTPADQRTIFYAIERRVQACMRAQGFDYPTRPFVSPLLELTEPRPFGVWRKDEAATRGYHGPPLAPSFDPTDRWLQSLPSSRHDAAVRALSGLAPNSPPGTPSSGSGCQQTAQNAIRQNGSDTFEATRVKIEDLGNLASARTLGSAQIKHALKRWSSCMKTHGYTVASPSVAANGFGGDSTTAKETRQALQDVSCKTSSHLMDVYFQVESASEQEVSAQNQSVMLEFQAMRSAELKAAASAAQ